MTVRKIETRTLIVERVVARILVYSAAFFPNVGGLEMMAFLIARELSRLGHDVKLLTTTKSQQRDEYPFAVFRAPSSLALISAVQWSEVVLQFNVNLKAIWTWALVARPLVISHQSLYHRASGRRAWRDRLKFFVASKATNIAISPYVGKYLQGRVTVIPNTYDEDMFREKLNIKRDRDFLFVGRLVSDKGGDDFVNAFAAIVRDRPAATATIVGAGPESDTLKALVRQQGIEERMQFWGALRGEQLVDAMNQHKYLVVPSRWDEPFGIVALEAIACGCVVIGSSGGGLGYAIGVCGMTFPNRDVLALTRCMDEALSNPRLREHYGKSFSRHLAERRPSAIARSYEAVLLDAIARFAK